MPVIIVAAIVKLGNGGTAKADENIMYHVD
jgi:hypothetical protein